MATQPLVTRNPAGSGRTLRHALADTWQEGVTLLRQHAALALDEAHERTAGLGADTASLVGGVVLAHVGVVALAAAAGLGLHAAGLQAWLAGLIVGIVLLGAGLILVSAAKKRLVARMSRRSETLLAIGDTREWLGELLRGDES